MKDVKRGEIWKINLGEDNIYGSEQAGLRYCVIVQNNIGNKYSSTTIVALITSQRKHNIPTHMDINLFKNSTVMCEQLRTVDKCRLINKIRNLDNEELKKLNKCMLVSIGIGM